MDQLLAINLSEIRQELQLNRVWKIKTSKMRYEEKLKKFRIAQTKTNIHRVGVLVRLTLSALSSAIPARHDTELASPQPQVLV